MRDLSDGLIQLTYFFGIYIYWSLREFELKFDLFLSFSPILILRLSQAEVLFVLWLWYYPYYVSATDACILREESGQREKEKGRERQRERKVKGNRAPLRMQIRLRPE